MCYVDDIVFHVLETRVDFYKLTYHIISYHIIFI